MNTADPLFEELRTMIADGLGVEAEDVVPEARFFDDLGGESIDVIDLTFRCGCLPRATGRSRRTAPSRRRVSAASASGSRFSSGCPSNRSPRRTT